MKKVVFSFLVFFSFLPFVSSAQINKQLSDTLNAVLKNRAKLYNLKSAAAAVVFPDGSVWEGAYGNCGTSPTSSNMLFEMGSNTKTFTAALILQLAHEGKLNLNDTLYRFLPVHPNIGYGITIRQLLNHTSGIFSYTEHDDFFDFVNGDPAAIANADTILKNWMKPMVFKPGSKLQYSNTNYILLGKTIEKIDGVPYHQALRNRIFDKFELKESFLDVYEKYSLAKAQCWLNDGGYWDENFSNFMSVAWAAGALVSTPRDLAKWARTLYHGDVLPASWLDSMKTTISVGGGMKVGLGMFERTYNGKTYLGHGGTTLQNSEMEYSISSDFSLVTVVNEQGTGSQTRLIQNQLINVIEKMLPKVTAIAEKPEFAFNYFPNPATENFTVTLDPAFLVKNPGAKLNIYSLSGALQKSVIMNGPELKIHRDKLPNGMYILQIIDKHGKVVSRNKLILH